MRTLFETITGKTLLITTEEIPNREFFACNQPKVYPIPNTQSAQLRREVLGYKYYQANPKFYNYKYKTYTCNNPLESIFTIVQLKDFLHDYWFIYLL